MTTVFPFHRFIAAAIFCLLLMDSESFAQGTPSAQTTAAVAPLRPISVQSVCIKTPEKVAVHVVIETKYEYSKAAKELEKEQKPKRILLQFSCSLSTSRCEGLMIDLENVDHGRPLNFFNAGVLVGMKIATRTQNLFVVEWGPWRTFTVDFAKNRVEYRESATETEGYGVGACSM
jgi:hypothetical protein